MKMALTSKIVRSDGPIFEPIEDELVMLDVDAGKYYALNNIAAAIWRNLETKISVEDLCRKLCEDYDIGMEQCLSEITVFLEELQNRKLIAIEG